MSTASMAALEARMGTALVRRFANATARVADHEFNVMKADVNEHPGFPGLRAQSTLIEVLAERADVDAAPVDLQEGNRLDVAGEPYRITLRNDLQCLGQVQFTLEPAA